MAFDANELSPHEHFVVERTRDGEVADFTPMAGPDGAKPALRAGFLRRLMLGLEPSWPLRAPGLRIKAARIEGGLNLADCAGLPALSLEACDIAETLDLSHARLARLSLKGCRLRRIIATEAAIDGEFDLSGVAPLAGAPGHESLTARLDGARIDGDMRASGAKFARAGDDGDHDVLFLQGAEIAGDLLLDDGFEAFGRVWLAGARIGGGLICDGAHLLNRGDDAKGQALVGDGARIGGAASFRDKFRAEGEVSLLGARIDGDLDLRGAIIRNEFGAALALTNAEIAGQALCAAKLYGQVLAQGARIARNLDLRGAEIVHALTPRADTFGRALDAASLSVGGAALLQGASIKGEAFLADARIEGYFALGGGRFINGGGWAIRAPNVRVGGNLTLKLDESGYAPRGQKTVIEGGAKFDRAQIAGALVWLNLELRGPGPDGAKGGVLSLADANIAGALQARNLAMQQDGRVDVSGLTCAALDDDLKTGWGVDSARLDLEGFSYGRLESAGKDDRWRARLAWLKRAQSRHLGEGERFSPQPYAALAQVYARAGRREDCRRVLLAMHDRRTLLASAGPLTWALSSAFGLIAGYGFAPIRAARALVLFLALGVAGVLAMNGQGALVTPQGRACNGAIEPALYAMDVMLPVIDLGQESACAPGATPRAALYAGIEVPDSEWRLFEGGALWRWAHALYAILGAILTALAIITFSGLMKPKEE